MLQALFQSESGLVTWVILPILIFCARTTDVGLSTLRFLFIAQGRRLLAPVVGFFEALIWLFVIGQILGHLGNPVCVVAYAGGFAFGNVAGIHLEQKMAMGFQVVRIISGEPTQQLAERLAEMGIGATTVEGRGLKGPVTILFMVLRRREVPRLLAATGEVLPRAFVSIEDVRRAQEGTFLPAPVTSPRASAWHWLGLRKGK